jgi:predicted phage terminase large subunit-like protein
MQHLHLNQSDIVEIERALFSRSFKHFVKAAWHILEPTTELKWGWAVEAICDHLQAVSEGKFNRLLMNVPPGCMKSLLTGVLWPAWEWTRWPERRFIGTSHKQDLAVRDNMKCRRLITSEWYQRRWPLVLMGDNNAKTRFENDHTGFREAMAFTSMTGARGDRVILDDPLSVDDGNSDAALAAAEITFTEALPTRVNNDQSAIVVIMQRLNERDTSGIILERDLGYVHLCLPMRFEADRRCVTPIFTDPRTEDGQLLFPERFSNVTVTELERSLGSYASAGQLQQRPAPRGGGLFKETWWRFYDTLPELAWRAIYVDTAQKTGNANDYSVMQCWGRAKTGQAYLIDQVRGKWEAPELLTHARAFWNKHRAQTCGVLRAMKIEDKVSGTGLIQTLRREGMPVIDIQRDKDKMTRAMDAIPTIESGNVYLPRNAEWLSEYLKEFSQFPNGRHDDQVDPTCDAITDMTSKVGILDFI